MPAVEGRPLATTREGRPIIWRRHGPASTAPILVVGGVHGDEPASVDATRALDTWLEAHAPERTILVVPALNLDGLARRTKDNAGGIDLNRNFASENWAAEHPPGYAPGLAPLSEPETAGLSRFIEEEGVGAVVAVHAPFACVNFDGPAEAWAARVASASGWPVQASIGYPTPGSLGSWFGGDRGRPILTLELPPGPYTSFRAAADAALRSAVTDAPWGGGPRPDEEAARKSGG